MPTTSRSSPTTTRAVNEKRRPPLTTLATRLISTTRSCRSRPEALTERSREMKMGRSQRVAVAVVLTLDGDAGLADRLGESAHVAVIAVAAAIEHRLADARRLGALGERVGGAFGALGLGQRAKLGLIPVHGGERTPARVVDQLRGEPLVGAKHRDPRAVLGARDLCAHAPAALEPPLALGDRAHARLPTLRATYSPS